MTSVSTKRATLIAAMATIGVCDVAFGLTLQLQPLLMDKAGLSAWTIGTIAAAGPLGILIGGPFLPKLIARFGLKPMAIAAIFLIVTCLAAMALLPPLYYWYFFRFFLGMATSSLFTIGEVWMLSLATQETRGRIMGIYTSMLSITFAIGPYILPFTGIDGLLPWIICIVFVLAGLIPLLAIKPIETAKQEGSENFFTVIGRAPLLFLTFAACTLFDAVIIAFFTIYATRHGISLPQASTILGTGIISGVTMFYAIGMWADRWSKNGVIMLCAITTVAATLVMPLLINTIFIWPLIIILMTAAFGVYVVALAAIGDIFKGNDVVAASAAVGAMWGVGGMLGPTIAGRSIDAFGIDAFPMVLASFYAMLLLAMAFNGGRVVAPRNRTETAS
jgi:MFS family permease